MSERRPPRRAGDPGPRLVPTADNGIWQCSGCHIVFHRTWQQTCPACGRHDYWTGSIGPHTIVWPALKLLPPPADGESMETTMIELDDAILESRVNAASVAFRAAESAKRDVKEARRRARLEKRIRAVFAAYDDCTWLLMPHFTKASVSRKTVLDAESLGIVKRSVGGEFRGGYRLVRP